MTDNEKDNNDEINLEHELAAMTQYPGSEAPQLWRKALTIAATHSSSPTLRIREWINQTANAAKQWREVAALLLIAVTVSIIAVVNPFVSSPSNRAEMMASNSSTSSQSSPVYRKMTVVDGATGPLVQATEYGGVVNKSPAEKSTFTDASLIQSANGLTGAIPFAAGPDATTSPSLEPRQVIRKATVELHTDDVRAAYLKVQMLINQGGGEFIENSSISGAGDQMQADLTLRVAASRLSEVINSLGNLGKIISQQQSGEDVTAQAVDLDARLSNERKVEDELLKLLDARKNDDLDDILKLRQSISDVREKIEQMEAQKEHLDHLVSLATVLVVIRHDAPREAKPTTPDTNSAIAYFKRSMSAAWEEGVNTLSDSIAWFAQTLIGGLIWWVIVVAAVWGAWRKIKAGQRRAKASDQT